MNGGMGAMNGGMGAMNGMGTTTGAPANPFGATAAGGGGSTNPFDDF